MHCTDARKLCLHLCVCERVGLRVCVKEIERAVCVGVYSIHYSGATDKLLPG